MYIEGGEASQAGVCVSVCVCVKGQVFSEWCHLAAAFAAHEQVLQNRKSCH